MPIVDMEIHRPPHGTMTDAQFVADVNRLLKRFGFFLHGDPWSRRSDRVVAHVIGAECAHVIANELKALFGSRDEATLAIPARLIHPALVDHPSTAGQVTAWLQRFRPKSLRQGPNGWRGDAAEVRELSERIRMCSDEVKLTHTAVPCPMHTLRHHQDTFRRRGWSVNERHRVIIAPLNEIEEVQSFLPENESDALGCIMFCDKTNSGSCQITVYQKDGTHKTSPLCVDCVKYSLEEFTRSFYENETMDYEKLAEITDGMQSIPVITSEFENGAYWPQVPLGQLLLALLSTPELSRVTKAWVSGVVTHTLRNRPQYFTFCHQHPHAILELPADETTLVRCRHPGCQNVYCRMCLKWHDHNDFANCRRFRDRYTGKRCPRCHVPSEKASGCNHVQCLRCQIHWCYECGFSAHTSGEVYSHMERSRHNF
jgi:hypothetical protein